MQRRQKGQKRSSGANNNYNEAVSPDRVDFLLNQNEQEVNKSLETVAEESNRKIDHALEDFKNTPNEILEEASDKENIELAQLNNEAENITQEAKEEIKMVKSSEESIAWGRSPKKITTESHHFEASGGTVYSAQPKSFTKTNEPGVVEKTKEDNVTNIENTSEQLDAISEAEAATLIEGASSLEELKTIISEKNISLTGSRDKVYDSQDLITMIDQFDLGSVPTMTAGLRQKICEIVLNENPEHPHALALLENISNSRRNSEVESSKIKTDSHSTEESNEETKNENSVEQKSFNEFFTNLKLEDLEDIEKLREQFDAMMEDPAFLKQFDIEPGMEHAFQSLKDKYFENFISQAEFLLKQEINRSQFEYEQSSKKEKSIAGLKKEGKKFLKGLVGGGTYALASKAVMMGTRFIGGPASSVVKIAAGGLTGAAMSGFSFMMGKGFEKLNEKSLKKLAAKAEEMQDKGLNQQAIFAQLQEDMWALSEYDRQQKEDIETQEKESFKLRDEEIDKVFTGENIEEKVQKLDDIKKLFFRTEDIHKDEKYFKEENIKERQKAIKNLLENNALEEYTAYRISKTIEKMMAGKDLSETDIRNITLQAELLVDKEMNSILGDVVAQEKFEEISSSQKKNFKNSYVAKLFGNNPPETMLQALSKGFVSGSMAGIASDAGAGAIYMGMQRLQGSLRAEILKKSASEIKTGREIIQDLDNFQLTKDTFNQAESIILEARARIKLPDIKEVDRAKIELRIKSLQTKMIRQAEIDNIIRENDQDLEDLAKNIVSKRALAIEKASDIAKAEKARKSLKGLWKTFTSLSRQEKMKVLAKAGIEGAKGAVAGGIGAELVAAGSASFSGTDYDIEAGINNVANRATFGAVGAEAEAVDNTKDTTQTKPVDTTETIENEAADTVTADAYETDLDKSSTDKDYDIDSLAVDDNDLEATVSGETKIEIPKPLAEEDINPDTGEAIESDTVTADAYETDLNQKSLEKTPEPEVIDLTKDINYLNERLGIDILDGEPSSEELHKVICELDNDPRSLEASQAREAIKQLIDQKLLTEKDYTNVVAKHIGQELHLGNTEIVKNAIENSSIDIKSIIDTQAKVELEKSLGINTFDGEITAEELEKINLIIHAPQSEEAVAYLEKLHQENQISDQEKFNATNPSIEHAGFKSENSLDETDNRTKYNLSLELGQDNAPKHLEQVFYRLGVDHIEIDNENVTNLEAARILNVGANLRVLSEGQNIAGVSAEDFNKYVTIDGNKIQINDYEAFQENIIDKLAKHSEEIITSDNLDNVGAVAYIDNIKNETWGDMLSPAKVEAENINFDQAQIEKAEVRIFQDTLEDTGLGELATDIEFKNESSGTFVLDNETIEVKNNEIVQIGDTPLEQPIALEDKESGEALIAKTSEIKGEKFLTYLEDRQEEMLQRLNDLTDLQKQKIEILEPTEPMSEYQISAQLNETLDKLGIRNGLNNPEWDSLKQESVNYLLDEKNLPEINDAKDAVSLHHREQLRQLLDNAISKGELKVNEATSVEDAMKELAAQASREKLIHDISIAEQAANRSISETLGDQLREIAQEKNTETSLESEAPLESKTKSPEWLSPEQKAEMDEMMPEGWSEKDIPMYMRPDEGRANFDDEVEEKANETVETKDSKSEQKEAGANTESEIDFSKPLEKVDVPQEQLNTSNIDSSLNVIDLDGMKDTYVANHLRINQIIDELETRREKYGDDKDFATFEKDVIAEINEAKEEIKKIEDICAGNLKNGTVDYSIATPFHTPENIKTELDMVAAKYNLSSDSEDKMEAAMAELDDEISELETERSKEYVKHAAPEIYKSLIGKELPVNNLSNMNEKELGSLKIELENISRFLKNNPLENSILTLQEAEAVGKEYQKIIDKIDKQLSK